MVLPLHLVTVTLLCQLPDLDLIILIVAYLPLVVLDVDPKHLYLHRQPLNLNALEDDYEVQLARQILLLVIG